MLDFSRSTLCVECNSSTLCVEYAREIQEQVFFSFYAPRGMQTSDALRQVCGRTLEYVMK